MKEGWGRPSRYRCGVLLPRLVPAVFALCIMSCRATREDPSGQRSNNDTSSVAPLPERRSETPDSVTQCGDTVVRDDGVGRLRIGEEIDSVRARCSVVRDTTALDAEGMPSRKITVSFGKDSLVAEIVNERVWRIEVRSGEFATRDSLHVGTPIARMLRLRNPRGLTGEGQLFLVTADHCGLSFRLSNPDGSAVRDWARPVLSKLPPSTMVSEILVIGCANAVPTRASR
jgi:hypothetical protein